LYNCDDNLAEVVIRQWNRLLIKAERSYLIIAKPVCYQSLTFTGGGSFWLKILLLSELSWRLAALREQGKKIVHCHGCFDLMHPGHIKYLEAAKQMGDILVVTLSPDRYVDKGPGRPVFSEKLRAECLAALECVDYVAINEYPTAEETLRLLRPHYYVKGQEFERLEDKTGKIQREYQVLQEIGGEMRFTQEIVFSSTQLLNKYFLNKEE
jgi:rfaE bifunctional protein nucleotidyltransferase chain/domain